MQLTTTIMLFFGATTTLSNNVSAAPISPRSNTVRPGQQSCKARDRGLVVNYATHIGAPYNEKSCNMAKTFLQGNGGLPSAMRCYDDGKGGTWLKFNNIPSQSELINKALEAAWDGIGFNCPNY